VLHRGKQVYIDGQPLYEIAYSDRLLIHLLEAFGSAEHHQVLQHPQ